MNKNAFLNAIKLKTGSIEVDEIGMVHFRELSAKEASIFEAKAMDVVDVEKKKITSGEKLFELSLYVLITCMLDEDGEQMWTNDDYDTLSEIPKSVIEVISEAIMSLSKMGKKKT